MASLTKALKEWAAAVDALAAGKTILLLRKGGIRETGRQFMVSHNPVLLYPAYEHQKPELLKPDYVQQVKLMPSGWRPESVAFQAWAQITHLFQMSEAEKVEALWPDHIWNEQFVTERLKWRPKQPLHILLLRTYRLAEIVQLPYHAKYGGCRSWIELLEPISIDGSVPVMSGADYNAQVETIQQVIGEHQQVFIA